MPCRRCSAIKPDGTQCRLTTCVRFPYCWIHLKSINGLVVKTSTVPGAGKGLFTTVARQRGDVILRYTGERLTQAQLDSRYGDRLALYAVIVDHTDRGSQRRYIDATDPQHSSVARYINDCKRRRCNTDFHTDGENVDVVANRRIAAGDEVFVSYGSEYWQ